MFIQWGIFNWKILIPFLFPLFLQIRGFIRTEYEDSYTFREFNSLLCLTLSLILYFLQKLIFIPRKTEEKNNTSNAQNKKVSNNNGLIKKEENGIKRFFFFIFISFCLFIPSIQKIFTKHHVKNLPKTNLEIFFEVLFLIPLTMILFGLSIFRHQKLSIILILLSLLIIIIEDIIYNNLDLEQVLKSLTYTFFLQLFYCLGDAFGIKYLNIYVENIFLFQFKIGLINTCALLLFATITHFMNYDNNNENLKFFQVFSNVPILYFIIDLFFSWLFEIGLWLSMYYFSPCYYFIFETISDFLEIFFGYKKFEVGQYISFFILYPILIFGLLVFNEVIILNFCGLDYNTKLKIMEREENDIKFIDERSGSLSSLNNDIEELGFVVNKDIEDN